MHIMRKSARKLGFLAVLLSFVLLIGTGCAKTGSTVTTSPVTYVSLINASALSSNVSVLLNDTAATVSGGIGPGQFSPKYGTVRPGSYDVKFEVASTDSLLSEIPSSTFDTLNFYTLILYTAPTGTVQSTKILDDFSTLSTSQANYRFYNLCSTHARVDLYLNSTLVQQGRTTADNVSSALLNGFQTANTGLYTVTVKSAGTDSTIVSVGNVSLLGGNAYTIFLSGVDGSSVNPLLLNVLMASY
jgi:Domain of unknown function (DUF4397)